MKTPRLLMVLAMAPPIAAHAAPTPCGAPGESALERGSYPEAVLEFEAAARDPACAQERERLLFNAAFALHEHSRKARDGTWCEARDAYRLLATAVDAELRAAATDGAELSSQTCDVYEKGRRMAATPPPAIDHSLPVAFIASGGGLALAGLTLGGLSLAAQSEADELGLRLRRRPDAAAIADAHAERRAEGRASAYETGAIWLTGTGIVVAAVGVFWLLLDSDSDRTIAPPPAGSVEIVPEGRGFRLRGVF